MGTRSGDIYPAIIEFVAKKEGKTLDEMMNVLNGKPGMLRNLLLIQRRP